MSEGRRERRGGPGFFVRFLIARLIPIVLFAALIGGAAVGIDRYIQSENKTTKIGFENIGELVTQAAFCTEVNVTEASRDLFGMTIPFTQSKYIYSYDVIVKAGYDFGEIEWSEADGKIKVRLPEAQILSREIDTDSFKLYHEKESVFTKITLEENNQALGELEQRAEEDAVANGLLENARANAEIILTSFFANAYDLSEYTIEFLDK